MIFGSVIIISVIKKAIALLMALINIFSMHLGRGSLDYMKKANITVSVNELVRYQTISGFGASACWWAQYAGATENAEEIARLIYSKEGLGLNIYRYNIGAGEKDNPNSRIGGSRATESFYYYNEQSGKYEYDFSRDAAAQRMLDLALSYGCVDTVVLFANSPHYSMTASGQASGSFTDFTCNLPAENYEAYADYFLTITRHFIEKGVPVKYISPINEPQWSWGGGWVGQEGCHYSTQEMLALYRVFAQKIKDSGLDVRLSAPESGSLGEVTDEWFRLVTEDEQIVSVLGTLSYHSYWTDNSAESKYYLGKDVRSIYSDFDVEMSEWCELPCVNPIDSIDGAVRMAKIICQDLVLSNVNSWNAWVAMNNTAIGGDGRRYSDGLLASSSDAYTDYTIAMRYYALAHFSKFIPAGSVRILAYDDLYDLTVTEIGEDLYSTETFFNCAAFITPQGETVLVMINEGEQRVVALNALPRSMRVYTTTQDMHFEQSYDGRFRRWLTLPQKSITTVVFG